METYASVDELEPKVLLALDAGTLTALLVILELLTALCVAATVLTLLTSMETCAMEFDELEPKDVAAFDAAVLTLLLAILETGAPRLDLELIVTLPTPVVEELGLISELLVPAIVAVKRKKKLRKLLTCQIFCMDV